jgi:hypothetical protein
MLVGKEIFSETKEAEKYTSYALVCIAPITCKWVDSFLIEEALVSLMKVLESFCEKMTVNHGK